MSIVDVCIHDCHFIWVKTKERKYTELDHCVWKIF